MRRMANVWKLPDRSALDQAQKRANPRRIRLMAIPRGQGQKANSGDPGQSQRDHFHSSRTFASQIRLASLPSPILGYPFAKGDDSKRFDLSWPSLRLAIAFDDEGYNAPGWRIIRIDPRQIKTGAALRIIKKVFFSQSMWLEMRRVRDEQKERG